MRGPTEDDGGEELAARATAALWPLTSPVRARTSVRPSGSLPIRRRAGTNHVPVCCLERSGAGAALSEEEARTTIDDGEKGREVSMRCPLRSSYSLRLLVLIPSSVSTALVASDDAEKLAAPLKVAFNSYYVRFLARSSAVVGALVIHRLFPEPVDEAEMSSREG